MTAVLQTQHPLIAQRVAKWSSHYTPSLPKQASFVQVCIAVKSYPWRASRTNWVVSLGTWIEVLPRRKDIEIVQHPITAFYAAIQVRYLPIREE
jgi:hypothetical protein